jgi:hypothetical protein
MMRLLNVFLLTVLFMTFADTAGWCERYVAAAVGPAYFQLDDVECQGELGSGWFGGTPLHWEGSELEAFPALAYCLKAGSTAQIFGWEFELFGGLFDTGPQAWSADNGYTDPLLPTAPFDGQLRLRFIIPVSFVARLVFRIPWKVFQPYLGFGPALVLLLCRDATTYDGSGQQLQVAYEQKWGVALGSMVLLGCRFLNTRQVRPYCEIKHTYLFFCRIPAGDGDHWLHFNLRSVAAVAGVSWHYNE